MHNKNITYRRVQRSVLSSSDHKTVRYRQDRSAHAPVNGGPVFPGTILGYFGLIKHSLAEFLLFSIILYITLAL